MFNELPNFDYSWITLRRICSRLRQNLPAFGLADHRIALQSITPVYSPSGRIVFEHTHPYYEAHILISGDIQLLSGSRQRLSPGHLMILPPKTPHSWQVLDKVHLDIVFSFDAKPAIQIDIPEFWPSCPKVLWELAFMLSDADEEYQDWQQRSAAHFTSIFSFMLATISPLERKPIDEIPTSELTAIVQQFILDNLKQQISLDDIAAAVLCSRRSLTRKFRSQTGRSVMDYCHELRINSAIGLLVNTDLSIAEISREVGLPDKSYFCHCFHQSIGMTPQDYRKTHSLRSSHPINDPQRVGNRIASPSFNQPKARRVRTQEFSFI